MTLCGILTIDVVFQAQKLVLIQPLIVTAHYTGQQIFTFLSHQITTGASCIIFCAEFKYLIRICLSQRILSDTQGICTLPVTLQYTCIVEVTHLKGRSK